MYNKAVDNYAPALGSVLIAIRIKKMCDKAAGTYASAI